MIVLILFVLISLGAVSGAEASWYVVNADNQVVVKCEYEPDQADLHSRKESAVFSNEDIPLTEAEYANGKIIQRPVDGEPDAADIEMQNLEFRGTGRAQ